ncbi:MAG: hypothetical protein JW723_03410 [Bacteroidales bacterium]|nr:hypothetical protein [Bacteroidales bacterium]
MKHIGKRHMRHASGLIFVLFMLSFQIHAQTDKNEVKLQNLKNKIFLAESNVAAAELKLARADSLVYDGDLRIDKAEEEFTRISEEQKKLEKEYRTNIRALNKLAKSKDAEIAEKAEDDLKAMETRYKEDSKSQSVKIKMLTREATKAESDIKKGLDMKKAATTKLKDARKKLEIARKNHEDFVKTLDSD